MGAKWDATFAASSGSRKRSSQEDWKSKNSNLEIRNKFEIRRLEIRALGGGRALFQIRGKKTSLTLICPIGHT